jgi:hypothetical protein
MLLLLSLLLLLLQHSGTSTNMSKFDTLSGAGFAYHPEFTHATMVVAAAHPSTAGLPPRWNVSDEIYNFDRDPRALGAVVVLTADETTYNDPGARATGQGEPHPICKSSLFPLHSSLFTRLSPLIVYCHL